MKLFLIVLGAFFMFSCATLPLTTEQKTDIAIITGCEVLNAGSCFGESALQAILPGIDASNCVDKIKTAYTNKTVTIDINKLAEVKRPTCQKALKGLGI